MQAQLASLTQSRDTLVKLRTLLKNKINNILSAHGINLEKKALSSDKKLNEIVAMKFDAMVNIEWEVIVEEIRSLNQRIAKLEKNIDDEGSKLEGHKSLTSIKGIGRLTGSILLSMIGDINDLQDEGELAAYFGIVPRLSNSNETERSGRITKRGSKLGRTALVQCALIAQRYGPYLKRYYEQVKPRRGTGKAIIALARKRLGVIYRTLKNKWERAVSCAGRCPARRQRGCPLDPGPLSLPPHVPERSSPSRVRFAGTNRAPLTALGPSEGLPMRRESGQTQYLLTPRLCAASRWSAPSCTTTLE